MKPSRPPLREVVAVLPAALRLLARLRWLHPRRDIRGLAAAVTSDSPRRSLSSDRAQTASRLCGAIIRRLPRIFPQPCLYWSLAACHFLRRAGQEPVIHIGVRVEAGEIVSHAWLTVDEQIVAGQSDPGEYQEMLTLP
ncbi:MAG: lasso peptide biosynthesis B2 protein [Armatimonadota bacterium]